MGSFRVAGASEYLAITGWGVDGVKLAKKAWVWLGQRCTTLDAAPASYELEAHGVTAEKFPVVLRVVCTVGPKIDDKKQLGEEDPLLLLDAKLLPTARRSARKLVEGVVEGRVRALAAGMTAEQIFAKGAAGFTKEVLESAQPDLGKYGLRVYGATVERLAAPAAMDLSVQVGQGATVSWSSKVKVATKKAGYCVYKMTKVTILEDEASARQQAAGVQCMMAGVQSNMAGAQSMMAGGQSMMAGAQSMMAVVHSQMAGVQIKMFGV